MSCTVLENDKGEAIGFICGSAWGMGVTTFPDEPEDSEWRSIYGFAHGGDPHDFDPDYECNTAKEIKAWEDAKAACKCGR